MIFRLKTYPPVAADIPVPDVIAAWRSDETAEACLGQLRDTLRVKHLFPVNSGRAALYLILKATLPDGSKVIVPGYTCYTVPAAVMKAGMTPVISDSDPNDLGYDLSALLRTIESHPDIKAVVVCHLFGIGLDIDAIREITGPDRMIIDDAAQAFGIKIDERYLGTKGDAGFYSFGRGKNLSLVGGGLIVTDDDTIAGKISNVMDEYVANDAVFGGDLIKALSYNTVTAPSVFNLLSRLPGMHLGRSVYKPEFDVAGMAIERLRLLARIHGLIGDMNRRRDLTADRYLELLDAIPGISIPRSQVNGRTGSLRFPILVDDPARRAEILTRSRGLGYGISPMYPTALNAVPDLAHYAEGGMDGAERIARSILTLPTHRFIRSADGGNETVDQIAGLVR